MRADIRFVVVRGVQYLRVDDVVAYIRELGSGEDIDVRNRLNEGAQSLTPLEPTEEVKP